MANVKMFRLKNSGKFSLQLHFFHHFSLARWQRMDLSVFESGCRLPTHLPHKVEASLYTFNCRSSSREAVNTKYYNLWFDSTRNRTPASRFNNRRYIHSTIGRCDERDFFNFLCLTWVKMILTFRKWYYWWKVKLLSLPSLNKAVYLFFA